MLFPIHLLKQASYLTLLAWITHHGHTPATSGLCLERDRGNELTVSTWVWDIMQIPSNASLGAKKAITGVKASSWRPWWAVSSSRVCSRSFRNARSSRYGAKWIGTSSLKSVNMYWSLRHCTLQVKGKEQIRHGGCSWEMSYHFPCPWSFPSLMPSAATLHHPRGTPTQPQPCYPHSSNAPAW